LCAAGDRRTKPQYAAESSSGTFAQKNWNKSHGKSKGSSKGKGKGKGRQQQYSGDRWSSSGWKTGGSWY